jgi:hypothetical protein
MTAGATLQYGSYTLALPAARLTTNTTTVAARSGHERDRERRTLDGGGDRPPGQAGHDIGDRHDGESRRPP